MRLLTSCLLGVAVLLFAKAQGVPIYAVSVQNEPDANVDHESCSCTGESMTAFMGDYLGPALAESGTMPAGVTLTGYVNPADGTVAVVAANTNNSAASVSLFISGNAPCSMTPCLYCGKFAEIPPGKLGRWRRLPKLPQMGCRASLVRIWGPGAERTGGT
jgi:hypothetical protein